ncbi:FAD-binding oxidoreductase [Nonomuraea sp. MG754425]|nr:FAD-binding oxidoreductase [Nonomuraea sp. MG754425]
MRVVVIGSGIVGAGAAYRLSRRGVSVTVLDACRQGEATQAGAGIVCPWVDHPEDDDWYRLTREGARAYPALVERGPGGRPLGARRAAAGGRGRGRAGPYGGRHAHPRRRGAAVSPRPGRRDRVAGPEPASGDRRAGPGNGAARRRAHVMAAGGPSHDRRAREPGGVAADRRGRPDRGGRGDRGRRRVDRRGVPPSGGRAAGLPAARPDPARHAGGRGHRVLADHPAQDGPVPAGVPRLPGGDRRDRRGRGLLAARHDGRAGRGDPGGAPGGPRAAQRHGDGGAGRAASCVRARLRPDRPADGPGGGGDGAERVRADRGPVRRRDRRRAGPGRASADRRHPLRTRLNRTIGTLTAKVDKQRRNIKYLPTVTSWGGI